MSLILPTQRAYGWKRSLPDYRDKPLLMQAVRRTARPAQATMQALFNPIRDQASLGACTGFGIASIAEQYLNSKMYLSPLFLYYLERSLEHSIRYDAGANIRDGMKVLVKSGICLETYWPYDVNKFTRKPSLKAYANAAATRVPAYSKVPQNVDALCTALWQQHPVVFGFSVYENFQDENTALSGIGRMPAGKMLGGHCTVLVGYDDERKVFTVRNQWGMDWGDKGYFTLPYEYVTNADLASDFWTITSVSSH